MKGNNSLKDARDFFNYALASLMILLISIVFFVVVMFIIASVIKDKTLAILVSFIITSPFFIISRIILAKKYHFREDVDKIEMNKSSIRRYPMILAPILSVSMFIIIFLWSIFLQMELAKTRSELEQIRAEAAPMLSEIEQYESVAKILANGETIRTLTIRDENTAASAKLVVSHGNKEAVLIINGLPALPPERLYRVWLIQKDKEEAVANFLPTNDQVYTVISVPEPFDHYTAIIVTIEKNSDSQFPSNEIVLMGTL